MGRSHLFRVLVILNVMLSASASAVQAQPAPQGCSTAKASYRIGFASLGPHTTYRDLVSAGIQQAAQKSGKIELAMVDEQEDVALALTKAKQITARGLDGVIGYPSESQFGTDVMEYFRSTKLPMIAVDGASRGATFVGADIRRAGLEAGKAIAEWINQHWSEGVDAIVMLEPYVHTAIPSAQLRGMFLNLQNNLKAKVPDDHVIHMYIESTRDAGNTATVEAYRKLGLLSHVVILAMDDARALGAVDAVRKLERNELAIVIGQHSTLPGLDEIARKGSIYLGANNYFPEKYGEKVIQAMLDLLECKTVPATIYTDFAFITKFNLCQYYPDGAACTELRSRGFPTTSTLDPDVANELTISMDASIQLQPGQSHDFNVGLVKCCVYFQAVEASVVWSVTPAQGASIDPQTGVLTIDPTTQNGSVFTVTANVENGQRILSIQVYVYTPQASPLVGIWREEAQLACGTESESVPTQPIKELRFNADGTFTVTWTPFEVYVDYWGTYIYDQAQGTLELVITRGNYIPKYVDTKGRISFDQQGRLILHDMWLGNPSGASNPVVQCGHRFTH